MEGTGRGQRRRSQDKRLQLREEAGLQQRPYVQGSSVEADLVVSGSDAQPVDLRALRIVDDRSGPNGL